MIFERRAPDEGSWTAREPISRNYVTYPAAPRQPRVQAEAAADAEFVELYASLHAQGYRVAFRLLGDAAAAEDAAAEGFARTYSRWSDVRLLPHRETWVMRVISNVALDVLGRKPPPTAPCWNGADDDV